MQPTKLKLTKTAIDAMRYQGKLPKGRDLRWDETIKGFSVRVWPSGAKVFCFTYWYVGRQRCMHIGRFGEMTLEQARERALRAKLLLADGTDPLELRKRRNEGKTFGDLAVRYIEKQAPRKASGRDDVSMLRNHVLRLWRNRPLASITHADVIDLHERVTAGKTKPEGDAPEGERTGNNWKTGRTEGGATVANRVVSLLSRMFNLARKWEFLPANAANPASGIERNKEQSRERFVTVAEMPALAKAIDAERNLYVRGAIWLYLLTGARKMALLRLHWDNHVDREQGILEIPETKTSKPTRQPLTKQVLAVLDQLPRLPGNPYVFCSHMKGRHLVAIERNWRKIRSAAGLDDVRIHDLRHTLGTWLGYSNHAEHLIGKALNNSKATRRYINMQTDALLAPLEQHGERLKVTSQGPIPGDRTQTSK